MAGSDGSADLEQRAADELRQWAGCTDARAKALVTAVRDTAVKAALGTISGDAPVASTLTEQRLLQLQQLSGVKGIGKLSVDEIGGVFRITAGQAKALDRTFHARFPRAVEDGLNTRLAAMKPKPTGVGPLPGWLLDFADAELRDHAVRKLRRAGIQKDVSAPRESLELTFPEVGTTTADERVETLPVLGIARPR